MRQYHADPPVYAAVLRSIYFGWDYGPRLDDASVIVGDLIETDGESD